MESMQNDNQLIKVFYSYAPQDKRLRDQLGKHLTLMKRQGLIADWNAQDIKPGQEWKKEINKNLEEADIILLLVSANFINSKYCDSPEVDIAMQRHEAQEAWVIPILIRSVDWETSSIGKLQALPYNLRPVDLWSNRDSAFARIAKDIRTLVVDLHATKNKAVQESEQSGEELLLVKPSKRKKRNLYKTLAKANAYTIGEKIQHKLRMIGRYFSYRAAHRRTKNKFSLIPLFLFGVLDLLALPTILYQWTVNTFLALGTFILTLLLFGMGTFSKNNMISAIIAFVYCIVWTLIGYLYLNKIDNLHLSFFSTLFISTILACIQLILFYTPNRKKRRLPFFPSTTKF